MKKWMLGIVLLFGVFLGGCRGAESFEVIADNIVELPSAEPAKVELKIPEDGTLTVMSGNDWQCYEGEHYQIILQTYPSGDLNRTLQNITGYDKEHLSVMEISGENIDKYLCAWSAVSEEGELVGRCSVLDDGIYHYCLSVLVDAEVSGEIRDTVDAVFAAYSLEGY